MQFRDLNAQYYALKDNIDKAMIDVAESSKYIMGKQVVDLEDSLADYVGVKHCVTCANGTDALSLALMAWDIDDKHAVFVPDFTFFSSAEVISYAGATPIFVDVDKETFNLDYIKLEQSIKRVLSEGKLIPKVIVSVDLFGLPANYPNIKTIADKYNMLLLEDGAQGFGGSIEGKMSCSFGDISTTSFFPAKPLGCYGDGGALFTDDDEIAYILKSLRVHGKGMFKYDNIRIGLNSRLDTIQAAILLIKLEAFKKFELQAVNIASNLYTERLRDIVKTPIIPIGFRSSWAQYTIVLDSQEIRDGLQIYLKDRNVPSMVYYPKPMHMQTAFSGLKSNKEDLNTTTYLCDRVLSLPMHPYITQEEIKLVCDNIKSFMKSM